MTDNSKTFNLLRKELPDDSRSAWGFSMGKENIEHISDGNHSIWTWWSNRFHPQALYFTFYSKTITSTVVDAILSKASETALTEGKDRIAFAEYEQYLPQLIPLSMPLLRSTYEIKISGLIKPQKQQDKYQFLSLPEISSNPALKQKFLQITYNNYKKNHIVNPVAEMESKEWGEIVLPDIILDIPSVVLGSNQQIDAYSVWYKDVGTNTTLAYVMGNNDQLQSLLAAQMKLLDKKGLQLHAEFDSTNPTAMHCMANFNYDIEKTLKTFMRTVD